MPRPLCDSRLGLHLLAVASPQNRRPRKTTRVFGKTTRDDWAITALRFQQFPGEETLSTGTWKILKNDHIATKRTSGSLTLEMQESFSQSFTHLHTGLPRCAQALSSFINSCGPWFFSAECPSLAPCFQGRENGQTATRFYGLEWGPDG